MLAGYTERDIRGYNQHACDQETGETDRSAGGVRIAQVLFTYIDFDLFLSGY